MVGFFGYSGDAITEGQKLMLDDMHKRKIEMADDISEKAQNPKLNMLKVLVRILPIWKAVAVTRVMRMQSKKIRS